jgi:hypothetical protein
MPKDQKAKGPRNQESKMPKYLKNNKTLNSKSEYQNPKAPNKSKQIPVHLNKNEHCSVTKNNQCSRRLQPALL